MTEVAPSTRYLDSLNRGVTGCGFAPKYSDRFRSAPETTALIKPLMLDFGITRVACVTGLDCIGIPVWSAVRPNSRTLAQSQGKGIDDDAAKASAVMEAVEVATAERTDLPHISASLSSLTANGIVYDSLEGLLRRGSESLPADQSQQWIEGSDLVRDQPTFVPLEAAILADASVKSRYWQSTDGLASGNNLWEALLHGLCERVERDALALMSLRSDEELAARCVDPASFEDQLVTELCGAVLRAGFQIRLYDATCDTNTPVFVAFISPLANGHEDDWKHFDLSSGSGCHPLKVVAAIRAITEAAQTRVTTISAARDDFDPVRYRERLDPSLLVYVRNLPKGRVEPQAPAACDRSNYLSSIVERLKAIGVRSIIVVPLESGGRGFAVAKVLVPDLESPTGDRRARFGRRALQFILARR